MSTLRKIATFGTAAVVALTLSAAPASAKKPPSGEFPRTAVIDCGKGPIKVGTTDDLYAPLVDLRKGKHEVLVDDDHLIANHAMPGDDPELEYMKRTYAREFQAAFAEALANLGAREQTLLRSHHVDGLNIDEIGAIYRVHRVTAFRWLEKAKEKRVEATLILMRTRLNVSPRELDSVLRLIRSQVHLSLVRHLGGPSDRVEDDVLELDESEIEEV